MLGEGRTGKRGRAEKFPKGIRGEEGIKSKLKKITCFSLSQLFLNTKCGLRKSSSAYYGHMSPRWYSHQLSAGSYYMLGYFEGYLRITLGGSPGMYGPGCIQLCQDAWSQCQLSTSQLLSQWTIPHFPSCSPHSSQLSPIAWSPQYALHFFHQTWVQSLGWEDPREKEMATHSSILAWRIPWMEEAGGLQSTGSQRVRHDWAT